MADRPKGYGLTAELDRKIDGKWEEQLARDTCQWIQDVLEFAHDEPISLPDEYSQNNVHELLKDGKVLCRLVNGMKPGMIKKVNDSKMVFKQMENISHFLTACEDLKVAKNDLFQTVDLYEKQNMPAVITGIQALGRKSRLHFDGPTLGPKESDQNRREFSKEQLEAGKNVIGLQMGTNKGASQEGMAFGKTRHIVD